MKLLTSWKRMTVGGAAVLAVTTGLTAAFVPAASVSARAAQGGPSGSTLVVHRGFGDRGGNVDHQALLAEALGISVDRLTAAHDAVRDALLAEAVANGDITQEQADRMQSGEGFGHRGFTGPGFGGRGFGHHGDGVDLQALLAEELGISGEALEAARQEAHAAALAQAVADGDITQEQADLMQARRAVAGYLDHAAILAQALGISVEELVAAREAGTSLRELIAERGLDRAELQAAMQSAYAAALERAVAEGVITTEQAERLQSDGGRGFGRPGGRGRGHGRDIRDRDESDIGGASSGRPRRGTADGSL